MNSLYQKALALDEAIATMRAAKRDFDNEVAAQTRAWKRDPAKRRYKQLDITRHFVGGPNDSEGRPVRGPTPRDTQYSTEPLPLYLASAHATATSAIKTGAPIAPSFARHTDVTELSPDEYEAALADGFKRQVWAALEGLEINGSRREKVAHVRRFSHLFGLGEYGEDRDDYDPAAADDRIERAQAVHAARHGDGTTYETGE